MKTEMKGKKVDDDLKEAESFQKIEYQINKESENMIKEEMVEEINNLLKKMPKRNQAKLHEDILENYKYEVEKDENE